jgi:hypothetical protein
LWLENAWRELLRLLLREPEEELLTGVPERDAREAGRKQGECLGRETIETRYLRPAVRSTSSAPSVPEYECASSTRRLYGRR